MTSYFFQFDPDGEVSLTTQGFAEWLAETLEVDSNVQHWMRQQNTPVVRIEIRPGNVTVTLEGDHRGSSGSYAAARMGVGR